TQQGRQIYEVDRHDIGAEPLRVIDASRTGLQYVSGLAAVDVGGTTHYWVTDRRSDCSALDGLLMELSAGPVSNRPPTLAAIPDQTVVSGETLTFTAVASDLDPGQSLTFSLVGAPAGATIGPTSGVFSWVASGNPRELEFEVRVTDTGSPQLSADRTVQVTGGSQPEEPPEDPEDPGEPPGEPGGPDTPPPGGGGGGSNPPGGGDGGSKPPAHPDEPGGGGGSNQPPANPQDPGSKPTEPSDSFAFSDDNGHVFEADIEWLASKGITRGCNPPINDRFCPDDFVTRGQMAAFLVRALGNTDDGGGNEFVDDDGTVFEGDIDRLATAGVTRGCNPPRNDRL